MLYRRSATAARNIYASQEAIEHLRRALSLIDTAWPAIDQHTAAQVCEDLGDLLRFAARYDEATGLYVRAQTTPTSQNSLRHARLWRKRGDVLSAQHQSEMAMQQYAQASTILGLPPSIAKEHDAWWQEWLDLHIALMWVHYQLAQVDAQEALAARIRPVVERVGLPEQAYRFLHSLKAMRQRHEHYRVSDATLDVFQCRRTAAKHPINLDVKFGFHLGMLAQEIPYPRHCQRGCLVPCKENGHHFIAQLLFAHALTSFFVVSIEQH